MINAVAILRSGAENKYKEGRCKKKTQEKQ
jgi:hypothetical protein